MSWCESQPNVYYCLGMSINDRLKVRIAAKHGKLRHDIATEELPLPTLRFTSFDYRTRASWSRSRRVIAKLEVLPKGENPRFIATNLPPGESANDPVADTGRFQARELYEDFYCQRGDMESKCSVDRLPARQPGG